LRAGLFKGFIVNRLGFVGVLVLDVSGQGGLVLDDFNTVRTGVGNSQILLLLGALVFVLLCTLLTPSLMLVGSSRAHGELT